MNIVVLGKGHLGIEFFRRSHPFVSTVVLDRDEFEYKINKDAENQMAFLKMIQKYKPNVIVNCIGISDTRWCEQRSHLEKVKGINGDLPAFLSLNCAICNIKLVHISTGCLYNINSVPQTEEDFIEAHCVYTMSKWLGEQGCDPARDLILRPRLFFSSHRFPNNLMCKLPRFLRYTDEKDTVTSTKVIVEACYELLKNSQVGIFNVGCRGITSMLKIAKRMNIVDTNETEIVIYPEELRKTTKLYLVHSTMNLDKLSQFYVPPTWEEEVDRCWNKIRTNNMYENLQQ